MRKLVVALLLSFLIFGILLHAPLVNSEEGNNSGSDDNRVISAADDDSDDDNETGEEDDEDKNETEDEEDKDETRIRERTREILTSGNCTIKVEKTVKIESGKRVEVIKRKMECTDGTKAEIKIKIENRTTEGKLRERIEYEFEGEELEVEAEEGIDIEEESNATHYKLKARLRSNGNVTDIKIMPDTASEIALERLRALNFTIELREIKHKNIPRVVYHIEADKTGRFLGIFKLKLKVETEVDPETGEVVTFSKPWWAFLVAGEDSDQAEEDNGTGTGNETTNETNNSSF